MEDIPYISTLQVIVNFICKGGENNNMERYKKLLAILLFALGIIPISVFGASSSYYATTTVYFNVPSDATFNIALPTAYSNNTATQPSAVATSWISFNFTSIPQSTLQQPYVLGSASTPQNGPSQPIFLIYNTGNTNETIQVNSSAPATGISLYFNASCAGSSSCTSATTTLTAMSTGLQNAVSSLFTGQMLNITLWANTSSSATQGQSSATVFVKSVATA
jgi:hypothetical protein